MTATPDQLDQLREINSSINAIPYEEVPKDDSADIWVDAPAPGSSFECRDYTVAKAKALRDDGWPVQDMSVVLCWIEPEPPLGDPTGTPVRQYHAVLAVNASGDIYILDNRAPDIYLWSEPPYDYLWAHQQIAGTTEFRDASQGLV